MGKMDPGLLSNSFAPVRRIDTVYRVPEMSRESVDAWKNIPSG